MKDYRLTTIHDGRPQTKGIDSLNNHNRIVQVEFGVPIHEDYYNIHNSSIKVVNMTYSAVSRGYGLIDDNETE